MHKRIVFRAYYPGGRRNAHETRLPSKSQLVQVLSSLQKQLDEQREEAAHEREKAALKRDAVVCAHNQLFVQIETRRRSQPSRNLRIEGSRTPPSPLPCSIRATHTESNHRHVRKLSPRDSQYYEKFGLHRTPMGPHMEDMEEIV